MSTQTYEVYWNEQHCAEVESNDEETAWDIARQRDPDETYCAIVGDIQVVRDRPQTEISDEISDAYQKEMAEYVEIKADDYEDVYIRAMFSTGSLCYQNKELWEFGDEK